MGTALTSNGRGLVALEEARHERLLVVAFTVLLGVGSDLQHLKDLLRRLETTARTERKVSRTSAYISTNSDTKSQNIQKRGGNLPGEG